MLKIGLVIINWLGLVLVGAFQVDVGPVSWKELQRQAQTGSKKARRQIERIQALRSVLSLQKIAQLSLGVSLIGLLFWQIAWWSIIVWLFLIITAGWISKLGWIRQLVGGVYSKLEPKVLGVIKKVPFIFKVIDSALVEDLVSSLQLASREELQNLIEEADSILDEKDRQRLAGSLVFASRKVKSVMVGRDKIDFLRRTEFLGPLTLDDLHRRGHNQFPVVGRDLDQIIGILDIADLLSLDVKKSVTAEKAMSKKVYYVNPNDNLEQALAICLEKRVQLVVVVNRQKQTVGIITLKDIVGVLLGYAVLSDNDLLVKKDN